MSARPVFVRCPHCPATVTMTEARRGHEGCLKVKRRYRKTQAKNRKADPALLKKADEELDRLFGGRLERKATKEEAGEAWALLGQVMKRRKREKAVY